MQFVEVLREKKISEEIIESAIKEIALEKCGIIKSGGVVVSYINKATENIITLIVNTSSVICDCI